MSAPENGSFDHRVEVAWEGGMRFRGGRPGGTTHLLDGSGEHAPSPVDALLVTLASCAAIDVVEILEKQRTPARAVTVGVEFSRADDHPRRITEARLRFRIAAAAKRPAVERALDLSFGTYCSVAGSLAKDLRLSWELELEDPSGT